MSVPEPNSPEALRAAQKVRNVFYMIAAANLVLIAIVMWPRPKAPSPPQPAANAPVATDATADPVAREMDSVFERLLAGYHTRDAERFADVFSPAAVPRPDEDYFRTVIIGQYQEQFGDVLERRIVSEATSANPNGGMLVHELSTKKGVPAKSTTKFAREGHKLRVTEWRLEKR